MQRGFAAHRHLKKHGTKPGGYGGYKWIPEFAKKKSLRVHVFVFDKKFDDKRTEIEAIEGGAGVFDSAAHGRMAQVSE